ncbi:hypothetical protein LSAT2_000183, partial [Lamellibrachia satsuma]
ESLSILPDLRAAAANVPIYRSLYSTDSTKPEKVKEELGVKDEAGVHTFCYSKAFSYFHTNFPRLVLETYKVVKEDKSEKKKKLLSDFPRAGHQTK